MRASFAGLRLVALLLFIVLNLADAGLTAVGTRRGLVEGNFLPALILSAGGEVAMYSFKLFAVWLAVAIVIKLTGAYRRLWYALYTADALLAIVVLGNLWQLMET